LTQVAKLAALYDVPIHEAAVDVRALFSSADKLGLEPPDTELLPNAFEEVIFQLTIESPASAEQVAKLVAHAERGCHAGQSFRAPVRVETRAKLNGEALPFG
jgi:hypothetical protein